MGYIEFEPLKQIKEQLGINPTGEVQRYFQDLCYNYMDKYIPMDTGNLAHDDIDLSDPRYIIYNAPYAEYQYYGMRKDGSKPINEENRNRQYHPFATSYWDKHLETAEIDDIARKIQEKFFK